MWSVFGSQNLPLPPRIYPLFNKYMRPSQNILLPPRIYTPFQQLYATLPESTPPSQNIGPTHLFNNSTRPSQNLPPPLQEYPPPFQQLYATLPDSTPPSQNLPHFQCQLYATLPQSTPPSQNIPPFSITICDPPRIYSSLPKYTPIFNNYKIMRPVQNLPLPPRIFFSSGSKW